jgi:hypothetical protein
MAAWAEIEKGKLWQLHDTRRSAVVVRRGPYLGQGRRQPYYSVTSEGYEGANDFDALSQAMEAAEAWLGPVCSRCGAAGWLMPASVLPGSAIQIRKASALEDDDPTDLRKPCPDCNRDGRFPKPAVAG